MKKCIICENNNNTEVYIHHKNFEIIHCKKCGLYFQHTPEEFIPLLQVYNNIYDDQPYSIKNEFYYDRHFMNQYNDVAAYLKITGSVLDIGCNYGWFMEYFTRRGWEATGIDISDKAIRYARSKGLNCYNATPETFHPERKFNAIILSNVLEHLERPKETLMIIKDWLFNKGVIYIRVPNTESIVLPNRYQSFIGDLHPFEHFFYFSHNNLKLLLDKAGLKSFIKTDSRVDVARVLNCYFRSKIVLRESWQNLNFKTETKHKKIYLLLKHIYGEIINIIGNIPIGPNNRELVALAFINQ